MTAIPVDTLRVWERRYRVVEPQRTASDARLYSAADVDRLRMIKSLVSNGHAIGSVATLASDELEALTETHEATQPSPAVASVLGYSDSLPSLDPARDDVQDLVILAQLRSWSAFESAVFERRPEALIVEMDALLDDRVDNLLRVMRRANPKRCVLVYAFAAASFLQRLAAEGVILVRAPASHEQLVRELGRALPPPTAAQNDAIVAAPRLFDDATLRDLAMQPSAVQCECPHHLAELIRTLTQFEEYSTECEHRDADDATLHAELRQTTAAARSLFEHALIDVAAHEGISLPPHLAAGVD